MHDQGSSLRYSSALNTHIAQDSRPRPLPYLAPRQGDNRLPSTFEEITPQSEAQGKVLWQRNTAVSLATASS